MLNRHIDVAALFGPLPDREFDILAYGDPNVDYVFDTPRIPLADEKTLGRNLGIFPGGTVANVACAASRLGSSVAAYGRVGNDTNGRLLLWDNETFGVSNTYLTTSDYPTAAAMIMVDASGEKALVYAPMSAAPLDEARLEQALASSRVLYSMPYDLEEFRRVSALARRNGTLVAIDIEAAVAPDRERLEALLACSDIVFMNEGGFRATCEEDISIEAARRLLAMGPRIVVITMGARGAIAATHETTVMQEAFPATLVDATGAGDCFNGAFLSAILQRRNIAKSLAFGCAAASIAVSVMGARMGLPNPDQTHALLSKDERTRSAFDDEND